jgi:hypothetical protein
MNLFRGAEYSRYWQAMNKNALTAYDMELSAQDYAVRVANKFQQLYATAKQSNLGHSI